MGKRQNNYCTVRLLQSHDLQLIDDKQEIKDILKSIGRRGEYGYLFVSVGDGEYGDVYGGWNSVPLLSDIVDKLN